MNLGKQGVRAAFISVWQEGESGENNTHNSATAFSLLKQMNATVVPLIGKYKGKQEMSMMVINPDALQTIILGELARKYKQESILVVTTDDNAYLLHTDEQKGEVYLGKMIVCSPERAINSGEDFSIDPQNDVAFQVVSEEVYNSRLKTAQN